MKYYRLSEEALQDILDDFVTEPMDANDKLQAIIDGPSDGWISVETKLPEKAHDVALVWIGTVAIGRYIKTVGWFINMVPMDSQITHWLPFPEPPKEDKT